MRQLTKRRRVAMVRAATILGLCLLVATDVSAQPVNWTLKIVDGVVTVNGGVVTAEELPESLDTMQNIQMQWSNHEPPVVAFGDRYYVLKKNGLRELLPDEIEKNGLPSVSISGFNFFRTDPSVANRQLVTQLNELVADLDEIDVNARKSLRAGAVQAAQTAAALPQLELQSYWYGLRKQDQQLYDDFLREQRIDLESRELAGAIVLLPSGADRQKLETELRSLLNQGFDLKQKNREREILQLEDRLGELQRILDERNAKREMIVNNRFKELVGSSN